MKRSNHKELKVMQSRNVVEGVHEEPGSNHKELKAMSIAVAGRSHRVRSNHKELKAQP